MANFLRAIVALLLLVVFTPMMEGCQKGESSVSTGFTEKMRVASPDHRVSAVLGERATGATVATVSEVHLVAPGQSMGPSTLVIRSDGASEMRVRWVANKMLSVEYRRARIFQFTNFWQSREVDNFNYIVEIRLNPIAEQSLPQ